ncbi:carbohydrate-binding module family 12 protein [Daedalea quercina L-15889]|uniref:Carbohydrate-binding module family 12 protein n=1 Tax=Daedalea quercina L-15889 TaxID=1314783 RepID=A0A165NRW4_9APHY|nr:carbohydrate-binding module family 12 protein [Daedalea quercina L-15889]
MSQVCEWEPGTPYGAGAVVVYQGVTYKIIQPHTSEPGWEPPNTPALWGRMEQPAPGFQQQQGGGYNPGYIQPQPPSQPQYQSPPPPGPPQGGYGGDEKRWDQHQTQQVDIHHEERKKNWWDLDDHRKKQLEIGGGLVAGLAAVGAGYYAYHEHNKTEEEKKAMVWGLQNWLQEAEARKRQFYERGPSGPATWILSEGGQVPKNALPVGQQNGETLFVCRGFYEGGIQIGKVSPAFQKGAVVGYGFKEVSLPKYEVLVGDPHALRWVDARGRLNVQSLGARPVEGGREKDGTPLFVARVQHDNNVIPGKVSEKLDGACSACPI